MAPSVLDSMPCIRFLPVSKTSNLVLIGAMSLPPSIALVLSSRRLSGVLGYDGETVEFNRSITDFLAGLTRPTSQPG